VSAKRQYPNPYTDDELPLYCTCTYHGYAVGRMADGGYFATWNGVAIVHYAATLAELRQKLDECRQEAK